MLESRLDKEGQQPKITKQTSLMLGRYIRALATVRTDVVQMSSIIDPWISSQRLGNTDLNFGSVVPGAG